MNGSGEDIQENYNKFEDYIYTINDNYYLRLSSSLKSMIYYMFGMVQLKQAEYLPNLDKVKLSKYFKLAALYRPDYGQIIIEKINS